MDIFLSACLKIDAKIKETLVFTSMVDECMKPIKKSPKGLNPVADLLDKHMPSERKRVESQKRKTRTANKKLIASTKQEIQPIVSNITHDSDLNGDSETLTEDEKQLNELSMEKGACVTFMMKGSCPPE